MFIKDSGLLNVMFIRDCGLFRVLLKHVSLSLYNQCLNTTLLYHIEVCGRGVVSVILFGFITNHYCYLFTSNSVFKSVFWMYYNLLITLLFWCDMNLHFGYEIRGTTPQSHVCRGWCHFCITIRLKATCSVEFYPKTLIRVNKR
jgi:hypothetical protein